MRNDFALRFEEPQCQSLGPMRVTNDSKLEWIDRNSDFAIRRLLDGEINFL
jgi:hypothetical protein